MVDKNPKYKIMKRKSLRGKVKLKGKENG